MCFNLFVFNLLSLVPIQSTQVLTAPPSPSPQPSDFFTKLLKEYSLPDSFFPIAVGIVMLGVMAIGLKFLKEVFENSEKLHGYWQKIATFFEGEPTQRAFQARKDLLKVVRGEVDRRLMLSLHNRVKIDLLIADQAQAVESPQLLPLDSASGARQQSTDWLSQIRRRLKVGRAPEVSLEPTQKLSEVFKQQVAGRLLILGEPGSGKTTELLKLAEDLIADAIADETKPIPIIFELSAWKSDQQSIHDWLIAQLREIYNVPRLVSEQWLKQQQLLPLFDGLDELSIRRDNSVEAGLNSAN